MRQDYSEDQRLAIRVAIDSLKQCDSVECVRKRVDEFAELGIDYECVGLIAIMRLGQLGIDSRDERYMEVERFFQFRTVEDYWTASPQETARWFMNRR